MMEVHKDDERSFCRINEEMTIYQVAAMRDELLGAYRDCIELEVDLSQVDEIDSAGVQLLLALKHTAITQDKPVRYVSHSASVVDIIQLFGIEQFFSDQILMPSENQETR